MSEMPPPNTFRDTRTELEKLQSILRTTAQILDKDQLEIWNSVTERNLHLAKQHNSGIPLLKQNITDQIKSYRLNLHHQDQLLKQVEAFDHLYVKEPQPPVPSAADKPSSEDKASPMEERIDMDHIPNVMEETAYLATSLAPLTPIVLSHNLDTLWNNLDHTACNHPLIHILRLHPHLLWSAMHCIMPFLKSRKIFARILKNGTLHPFFQTIVFA